MEFGSTVYGTRVPSSDTDYKSVFLPAGRDILLQRATHVSRNRSTGPSDGKNTPQDVDQEEFSFHGYLKLLCEGQTVAVDMLFVPDEHVLECGYEWNRIRELHHLFISKSVAPFVGYCRAQANKYGIKGSRMAAAKGAMTLLTMAADLKPNARLGDFHGDLLILSDRHEHVSFVAKKHPQTGHEVAHLDVCGKLAPFTLRIDRAADLYRSLWERYGERARQAMNNENIDWKALMHARRICDQAIELLSTGYIQFPRPNAEELLRIRRGERSYKEVAEEIERGIEQMELAMLQSPLREKPNRAMADSLVEMAYQDQAR